MKAATFDSNPSDRKLDRSTRRRRSLPTGLIGRDIVMYLRKAGFVKIVLKSSSGITELGPHTHDAFPGFLPKAWFKRVEAARTAAIRYAMKNMGYAVFGYWEVDASRPE